MWRHAYRNSRCLIPAEGWYEWQQVEQVDRLTGEIKPMKQPHFIHRENEPIFAFAGLMSRTTTPEGQETYSCAVMTKAAAPSVSDVHIRMPVVLLPDQYEQWIDPAQADPAVVAKIIDDAQEDFAHHPVSSRNESPELIEAI